MENAKQRHSVLPSKCTYKNTTLCKAWPTVCRNETSHKNNQNRVDGLICVTICNNILVNSVVWRNKIPVLTAVWVSSKCFIKNKRVRKCVVTGLTCIDDVWESTVNHFAVQQQGHLKGQYSKGHIINKINTYNLIFFF